MSQHNVTLQSLIEQVKKDLLQGGPEYPLFFVEKVELELQVTASANSDGGVEISLLNIGGVKAGEGRTSERGHTIRITLAPILSREEQRGLLAKDERMLNGIQKAAQQALRKGIPLAGGTDY